MCKMEIPTFSPDYYKDASEIMHITGPIQNRHNKYNSIGYFSDVGWISGLVKLGSFTVLPQQLYFTQKILFWKREKRPNVGIFIANRYSKILIALTSPVLKCLHLLFFNAQTLFTQWVAQHDKHNLWAQSPGPQLNREQSDFGQLNVTLANTFNELELYPPHE